MVIDTRVTLEGRSVVEQDATLKAFKDELPPFDGLVRCRAEIDRRGGVIVVDLRFGGVFEVQCVRCLKSYSEALSGETRVILKEEQGKCGPSLDDDSADFFFDDIHNFVDISSAIYDEIMTGLSMKPLCSEDCTGIEVKAGDNRNRTDPRWEALKKLKSR